MSEDWDSQYREVARLQYEEIEKLRALIKQRDAELDALVAWIAGDEDALGTLRATYVDPRTSPANRIKAAASALPFERSKPASMSVVVDFKSRVRDARLNTIELRKQVQPAELASTVLGGDHEGEALGPEPAA
jgi:hypothetical protein